MMKWIFSGMIVLAVLSAALFGRMDQVSNAAITECTGAVELTITLMGTMCMWSGMMRIAQKAGLTQKLSCLFAPLIRLLFRDMDPRGASAQAICLNISANLLGLGNAATPLGIAAMREMDKENRGNKQIATDNMCLFVVLNTASLQLIPTTTALLRANAGSPTPLDIMPATWVASSVSILSGVLMAKLLAGIKRPGLAARYRKGLGGT